MYVSELNYIIKDLSIYANVPYHDSTFTNIIRSFHECVCNSRVEQHWAAEQSMPYQRTDEEVFLSRLIIILSDTWVYEYSTLNAYRMMN